MVNQYGGHFISKSHSFKDNMESIRKGIYWAVKWVK